MTLPHVCPYCGARFGWGADAVLLSVVRTPDWSLSFDEMTPCCDRRIVGTVTREGVIDFDEAWLAAGRHGDV